jgi:hypothetical protein
MPQTTAGFVPPVRSKSHVSSDVCSTRNSRACSGAGLTKKPPLGLGAASIYRTEIALPVRSPEALYDDAWSLRSHPKAKLKG